MKSATLAFAALFAVPTAAFAADLPIPVVAAENFYGEVAAAVGGDRVTVESVIVSPGADPHDFAPPPSIARAVADARVVVMNGAEYDHWMERLLDASPTAGRSVIAVADLIGFSDGDNPHLWYDPRAVPALTAALADTLVLADPQGAADYRDRAADFLQSLAPLNQRIAEIRTRYDGVPVTASEPVFGPMAAALGLDMRNRDFQRAIMHETEPSARAIAEMEDDLRTGRVRVFFYNSQVVDPLTERLLAIAKEGNVPVVAVSETKPAGVSYRDWMLGQLDTTAKALAAPAI